MSKKANILKHRFAFDKVLTPLIFVIIPASLLRGFFEYQISGASIYFFRDIVNVSVILVCLALYCQGYLKKSLLFVVAVYSIVAAISYTFIVGAYDRNFQFEAFFLESEMILTLAVFAIGLLIDIKHVAVLVVFNVIFLVFCSYTTGHGYPIERFIYYGVLVFGAGLMAYASQLAFLNLNKEIKHANTLITQRNRELKSLNQSKDQLFRVIGHDLRTPFFQLTSLIEMLDEASTEEEIKEIKSLIKESAKEGNRLLEDLLGWGKKYQRSEDLEITKQNVSPIIDRVFDFFRLKAKDKGVRLVNNVDKKLALSINATMMETVVRNLVANAIKFSYRGSDVLIKDEIDDDFVKIEIIDIGIGMKPDQVDDIFQKDRSLSTKGTENEEGSGLGLNIARKLMEKQQGSLQITSIYGKGTIITLRFPLELDL